MNSIRIHFNRSLFENRFKGLLLLLSSTFYQNALTLIHAVTL